MKRALNILFIEGCRDCVGPVGKMLEKSESSIFTLHTVGTVEEGVAKLNERRFDLILSELNLPDSHGFRTLQRIMHCVSDTPVVVLTEEHDAKLALRVVKAGAQDYLTKDSITSDLLVRSVLYAVERQGHLAEFKRLSLVASKTSNAVIITDKEGCIEWVNEGFGRLTGYILKDVAGSRGEILRKGKATGLNDDKLLEKCRRSRKSHTYSTVNYKKDGGEYWAQTSLTPLYDKRGNFTCFIIVESDITDRVEHEEELQQAKTVAEEAKKAEERFLANMSHEIRTPLNAISGMAEMLYRTKLNQTQYKYTNTIVTASGILVSIIGDILDISKIKAEEIEFEEVSFDPYGLIYDVMDVMKSKIAEKPITLSAKIDDALCNNLLGDPLRLKQIFLNLVGNAVKFTEKGEITVFAKVLRQTKNDIEAEFTVQDTGIGVPGDKLNLIFESFQQAQSSTTRKYGGTGLGLAICRSLVQLQGGDIRVESEVNSGSRFVFNLGFKKDLSDVVDRACVQKPMSFRDIKFLLVEDNEMNQFFIKELFMEKWELEIDCAQDGEIALEMVARNDYDMVLMDVQMPRMDGMEATRRIRKDMPEPRKRIPILGMTANASTEDKRKCLEAGMDDYLPKPVREKELYAKISGLLTRKIVLV